MTNNNALSVYGALGLIEENDLPFEEMGQHTKEECYDLVRKCATLLEKSGCGPYTIFKFKQESNDLARRNADFEEYYGHVAKYLEFFVYKHNTRRFFNR